MSRRRLREEDIESFLNIPSGSEDEEDFSDAESDEDIEKIQSIENFSSESLSDVETFLSPQRHQRSSPVNEVVMNSECRQSQISDPQPSTSGVPLGTTTGTIRQSRAPRRSSTMSNALARRFPVSVTVTKRTKRRFIWKKTSFQPPDFPFTGNTNLQSPIIDFETPLQYFLWFFDDELLEHIVEEMHKFSFQKKSSWVGWTS